MVMDEIPMELGYCLIAGAMAIDPWLQFSGVTVEGYVASEVKKLMAEKKP